MIRIHQIYYRSNQRSAIDPEFVPYDNAGEKSPLLEFLVFKKIHREYGGSSPSLWGAVSWKFGNKTGITGAFLKRIIYENPGYDVYFCNPFPEIEGMYHNLWYQGESAHPAFAELSRDFLCSAGFSSNIVDGLMPSKLIATTNYFVASPKFWESYIAYVDNALERASKNLHPIARRLIFSSLADARGIHAKATYVPFIIERLFSLFLMTEGKHFRALKYPTRSMVFERNPFLQNLRQLKDAAVETRSSWMIQCWSNFRNLYFQYINSEFWTAENLRKISPLITFVPDVDCGNVTVLPPILTSANAD